MSGAFYIGAIGLEAQQRALDTIANNISNVNTPTFKRADVRFSDVVAGAADPAATTDSNMVDLPAPAGVMASQALAIDQPGEIETTGNTNDLAIKGDGFIEVMGPGGQTFLWRGGRLKVGEDGLLSTDQGFALKASISVPADAGPLTIGPDGVVRTTTTDSADPVEIGQIELVKVADPTTLERLDGSLYRADESVNLTGARPGEDGAGLLLQGSVERSNVDLTSQMVEMMIVQRAYAANAQIVQAADQLMAIANGLRR